MAIAEHGNAELTRKQVAHRLGIAETSVRRLEGVSLHPVHRGRLVFFDAREVESYAADHAGGRQSRDQGEVAARAFELFRAGHDFRDVVIELRQVPERVRQLFREYALGSDLLVPAFICREIEELGLTDDGRAIGAEAILNALRRLTEGNRRLVQETIDQWQRIQRLERALNTLRNAATTASDRTGDCDAQPGALAVVSGNDRGSQPGPSSETVVAAPATVIGSDSAERDAPQRNG